MSRASIKREIERVRDEVQDDLDKAMGADGRNPYGNTVKEGAKDAANKVLRTHGRVWQEDLLNSYEMLSLGTWQGFSKRYLFINNAKYAGAHNTGATFDAPPPPENLMPWVLDHMYVFETDNAYEAANNLSFHLYENGLEGVRFMQAAEEYLDGSSAEVNLEFLANKYL